MQYKKDELAFLQKAFWLERISGSRELSEEKIRSRMQYLSLSMSALHYCIVIFAPRLMEKNAKNIDKLLINILDDVQEKYSRAGYTCYTVSDEFCNIISILAVNSENEYHTLDKLTQDFTVKAIAKYNIEMYVGIGSLVRQLSDLKHSKNAAAEALSYKYTFSQNNVVLSKNVMRYYAQNSRDLQNHYDYIRGCFIDGNMELLSTRLHNLCTSVACSVRNPLESMRNVCIELTASLIRVVRDIGVDSSPELEGVYTYIAKINSIPEIERWFMDYCYLLLHKVESARSNKTYQIICQAEMFIQSNLSDRELTIQSISDHVNLSAPYFSNLFLKEKGLHINGYINHLRIEQAKKLLIDTDDKVYLIAEKTGFTRPSYFNAVFKEYTEMTPTQFRLKYSIK